MEEVKMVQKLLKYQKELKERRQKEEENLLRKLNFHRNQAKWKRLGIEVTWE